MVQRGDKKLKIKAKPSGQSYTAIPRSAFIGNGTKRGRPIREISKGIACTILKRTWSRNRESDDDSKTEPGASNIEYIIQIAAQSSQYVQDNIHIL